MFRTFKDRKATIQAQTLASHNLLTNTLRIRQVFDLRSKKNFFGLDFWFSVCYVTMRACLCIFGSFAWPWAPAQWELFSLNVFLDLWLENKSLQPLIYLLAHRQTKLWLKNPVFAKNLKLKKSDIGHFCPTLATRGWQPDWARRLFKPSKD